MSYTTSLAVTIESKPVDKSIIQKFSPLLPNLNLSYSNVLSIPIPPNVIVPLDFVSESVPYTISLMSIYCPVPYDLALTKVTGSYAFSGVQRTLSLHRFADYDTGVIVSQSSVDMAVRLSPNYLGVESVVASVFIGRSLVS